MLGNVIAPEARAVVRFDELEPIGELAVERAACMIHVIEYAEFHCIPPNAAIMEPPAPHGQAANENAAPEERGVSICFRLPT
jgi:hypothetical protein